MAWEQKGNVGADTMTDIVILESLYEQGISYPNRIQINVNNHSGPNKLPEFMPEAVCRFKLQIIISQAVGLWISHLIAQSFFARKQFHSDSQILITPETVDF